MRVPIYQVDAFTDTLFGGNPAAVCVLNAWVDPSMLLNVARENCLPETAFIVPQQTEGAYSLKWFTPDIEMDLCGHATLASAHVIFNHLQYGGEKITFSSNSGELIVSKERDYLKLDFPSRMPEQALLPEVVKAAFKTVPQEVYKARDYVLVYGSEETVRNLAPDKAVLDAINLGTGGIIATAKGNAVDFVSRFFTPQATIFEDPVTGSAHCSLIPFWSKRLNKKKMNALQVSSRLGKLACEDHGERVHISGQAITYLEGFINIF